ncbi:GNAT family N-acetyltransferase [Nocardia sp. NPDC058499]|uniref:GNAT family N-acetyltransferase n=1 Tax=Nocardia sp. NPDC058499 TaxID=3346530 RepID=UPI003669930F
MSLPPAHLVVRPALRADITALQEIARRTIDASYRSFLGDEGVDRFIDSGASDEHVESHVRQGHVYCLDVHGDPAGLMILDGPTVDLMMIDIRNHRRGLGKLLLSRAEEILFARYSEIRLETFAGNAAAIAFYRACGWSAVDRPDSDTESAVTKIEFVKSGGRLSH